jgi:SAM-dependent methyltransferase
MQLIKRKSHKYDAGEIKAAYERGQNIMELCDASDGGDGRNLNSILYSYDIQAGSYTAMAQDAKLKSLGEDLGRQLAAIVEEVDPSSLMECGTGEATHFVPLLKNVNQHCAVNALAFDLSLSRLLYARANLLSAGLSASLFTAELQNIPIESDSIDVVVTIHSVEPNAGYEREILSELLRVTRKRLILYEPSYELGSEATRKRCEKHGYVRGLAATLTELGHAPSRHELWGPHFNDDNESALIVVDKTAGAARAPSLVSPISKKPLVRMEDCLFCEDDGHAFPIVAGIPCLTTDSAIVATKLSSFVTARQTPSLG